MWISMVVCVNKDPFCSSLPEQRHRLEEEYSNYSVEPPMPTHKSPISAEPYSILISIPVFPFSENKWIPTNISRDVPSINCHSLVWTWPGGCGRFWTLVVGGEGRGAGGRTKWKEMEFLVSNINISRNVPNCWKVAFTNGEKISKGGEKPLFWTDHLSFSEWPPQIFHIWSWTIVEA